MGILDRVGLKWLLLSVALVPMAIAAVTAVRLSSLAADTQREAEADLAALERLISLGDYRTSVITETASYRGWTESIVSSDVDLTTPAMQFARSGIIRLASDGGDRAMRTIADTALTDDEAALVGQTNELLDQTRTDFSADPEITTLPQLDEIDTLASRIGDSTARLVDRRSDEWIVVDLHAEMMTRLSNEVFIVGTMLISGESNAESRRQGDLLVRQTDDTFERLQAAVSPDEAAALTAAFENEYTVDHRHGVAALPDSFEPLSVETIAGAPGDLARFGATAGEIRERRAEIIRDEAQARADDAAMDRWLMLAVAVAAIGIPAILLAIIGRRVSRRLGALTDAAQRLSEGELGVRAEGVGGNDELTLLANTVNDVSSTVSLGREQIMALAEGRFDDPAFDEQMPGPVGDAMRSALDRLGDVTAELTHEASHDRLTGLLDRHGFRLAAADLDSAIAWSVAVVDLDGFKAVNDTHGHAVGDSVLATVAARLAAAIPDPTLAARLGGDEFAAFVPSAEAAQITARVLAAIREPVTVDGEQHTVGASIGWAPHRHSDGLDEALHAADAAMYEAKRRGRDREPSSSA